MANQVKQLPVTTYNVANATKWIFNIPMGYLFNLKNERYKSGQLLQYPLNCKSVQFPQFKLGTTTVSFLNYGFDISTRQNTTQKTLTVYFLVSENWLQYLMLLKWFQLQDFTRYDYNRSNTKTIQLGNGIKQTINSYDYQQYMAKTGKNTLYSTQGPIVNTNLYLMDNFMNRIATFNFEGCFLTSIKNLQLDYAKTDNTQLVCTFTMSFYKYNFICNDKQLKNFIPDGGSYLDNHDKLLVKQ